MGADYHALFGAASAGAANKPQAPANAKAAAMDFKRMRVLVPFRYGNAV
jgi:hypothetical protein